MKSIIVSLLFLVITSCTNTQSATFNPHFQLNIQKSLFEYSMDLMSNILFPEFPYQKFPGM